MLRTKYDLIVGLTTFNHEFLRLSVSGLGRIGKNTLLVIHNDNPCKNLTVRHIRRIGYRGHLHIINAEENRGMLAGRFAILQYIRAKKISAPWFMFANDDDIVLNVSVPYVNDNTYAVMGNHEYIGNAEEAYKYIQGLGVTILRDSVAIFGDSLVAIVGRDDVSVQHFEQRERKLLSEMVPGDMMSIVVDHQPMAIEESAEAGATLYLSGHTHAGQVWPMRMFTKSLFRCDYGMYGFENTVGVVTSGYGTWGPRIRLGSNSEVVIVSVVR